MATGPTGIVKLPQSEYDDLMFEGCRLAHELKLADNHIDHMEIERTKYKDKIYDLECECAVFKAERDQADEEVLRQANDINDLKQQRDDLVKEVETLKASLQEWEDFEGWRQGRWVLVQAELKRLREELASLKNEPVPVVTDS